VDVISEHLGWNDLFVISTIHSFLWAEIKQFTEDIRTCLREAIIPAKIEKYERRDNGGNSQRAIAAREKVATLTANLADLESVEKFKYDETSKFSNYSEGQLSHDDLIAISGHLISQNPILQKIIGQQYPYIFIDEAQDTFEEIVEAFNKVCEKEGLPIVGYFGDPMQQIYRGRLGNFEGPDGSLVITKEENFRSTPQVVEFLNSFREDVVQFAAGDNANVDGRVELILVQAEEPEAPRNRYSKAQLDRVSTKFDEILESIEWYEQEDVKLLFLAREMIARRLGFEELHKLFTGKYSSYRSQEDYKSGEHYLLKPFISTIWPLFERYEEQDMRSIMNILRKYSPAFNPEGANARKSMKEMLELAQSLVTELSERWRANDIGTILRFTRDSQLCNLSDRLLEDLDRDPMENEYNSDEHSENKGQWLAHNFFIMKVSEIPPYVDFVNDNTPFSTQHGVKGEEYSNVVVLFDDVEAVWNLYSFSKMLTPGTSGEGTEGQQDRSKKLAYVCFSRAEVNLRVILFTPDPQAAKTELIGAGIFNEVQVLLWE
jgi:DNA helicase-2/ATP-dependent DNA helicase PcrA